PFWAPGPPTTIWKRLPMKIWMLHFTTVFSALIIAGCAGPAPRVVSPKFKETNVAGRSLHLLPVRTVSIDNSDDFKDDLGKEPGSQGEVISSLFEKSLRQRIAHGT